MKLLGRIALRKLILATCLLVTMAFVDCAVSQRPKSSQGWDLTTSNTGLAGVGIDGNSLPAYDGPSAPLSGTVIKEKLITTTLDLSAGNITLQSCYIRPAVAQQGLHIVSNTNLASLVCIYDCDIDCSGITDLITVAYGCGFAGAGDIERCKIHGMGSGIYLRGGVGTSPIARNNYIYGLVTDGIAHNDGLTIRDFSGTLLLCEGNRVDCDTTQSSGACFVQAQAGNIDNVMIRNNLLEGNAYNIWLEQDLSRFSYTYGYNLKAVNNRFTAKGLNWYGFGHVSQGAGWADKSDNYVENPSSPPCDIGATVDIGSP